MEDAYKTTGASKASKPDAGGGGIRAVPVFGIVKNNIDPIRAGRLQVYISDIGSDNPEDPEGWATVSYLPPFYGFVTPKAGETGYGDYTSNPSSYGIWNSPPDIGTTVICVFVNGDPNYGFYIGCVPKPEALHMVPAIGSSKNIIANTEGEANGYGGAEQLPVTNLNTNNAAVSDDANFLQEPKPVHSYSAMIFNQQGLIRDTLRGPITTSSQRETPSRVGWGVSTPGRPIFEGGYDDESITAAVESGEDVSGLSVIARRGGHTFVMDDGDLIGKDQLVRIRSAAGHQILMSDDGQTLFIIHSNGQSYVELGKEGTIDMYSTNSFNIRTQGDINLHADNDINIHAKKKLNIQAEEININSEKATNHKIGTKYSIYTMGTFTHKVDGPMSMSSDGDASYASSSITYINGSKVNLNTGATSTVPATVPSLPLIAHTDTLYDAVKGYAAAPGKLISITSRAPAHAPWANANQGVDIKTSSSASKEFPSSPAGPVTAAIKASGAAPITSQVTTAGIATVPPVGAASASVDPNTTGAMIGAIATNAASGPAAAAIKQGSAIVSTAQGKIAAIGSLAQTPAQLESAGILKPGSSTLVNGLVNAGSTVQQAMTNNLFTGKPGAESLSALVNNTVSQVQAQVTNIQKTQSALTSVGMITGKESPQAIAGVIMAGATAGIGSTISAVKNIASNPAGLVAGKLSGAAGAVTSAVNAGTFAAGLAQTGAGGLGSISSAIGSMGKIEGIAGFQAASKGISASAFSAITGSWKPLLVGVPQNLQAIARASASLGEAVASGTASPQLLANKIGAVASAAGSRQISQVASAVATGIGAANALGNAATINQAINPISNLLGSAGKIGSALGNSDLAKTTSTISNAVRTSNNLLNSVNKIGNASSVGQLLSATSGALNSASRLSATLGISAKATGLSALPGGQLSVSSIVNQALGKVPLPGVPALKSLISKSVTSAINNISIPKLENSINSAVNSATSGLQGLALGGLPPGAAAQLNSAISSLSSAGSSPIKLPTVGLNTFDRSEMTAQITSLLGNPKIPKPNFNGASIGATASMEALLEKNKLFTDVSKNLSELQDKVAAARRNASNLEATLPKGDPAIAQARDEWFAIQDELSTTTKDLEKYL